MASDLLQRGSGGRIPNRPDLLQQLQQVAAIFSDGGQDDDGGAEAAPESVIRSRRLRDRFPPEDLQAMIDLYRSGITARHVAEKFGVSLRSVKRLLHQHGICRVSAILFQSAHRRLYRHQAELHPPGKLGHPTPKPPPSRLLYVRVPLPSVTTGAAER